MLVDSHAHLDHVDDSEGVLTRSLEAGVSKIVTIGTSLNSSRKAIEIAEKYLSDGLKIFATCGLHPKDSKKELEKKSVDDLVNQLKVIAQSSKKVVAIGECGLDYYLGSRGQGLGTSEKDKKFQKELFKAQVELAAELKLPLVVHCRNGWNEISELLISNRKWLKANGVFHSWTGNWQAAKRALDLGFYISFSGIVTFKNAPDIQKVAKKMPIDRMLVETDSPFLTPEPSRGVINEPANVKIIAKFLSDIRNQSVDLIYQQTSSNAARLFSLK